MRGKFEACTGLRLPLQIIHNWSSFPYTNHFASPRGNSGVLHLRMPDALIIATVQDAEFLALVGNDRGWFGKTQPCEFLYLTELLDASGSA